MPYQSQDIPPRSRLYHLAPVGVGTPNVESLTSFVMRLAAAHCVKTITVIAQEIAPLINESEPKPPLRSINGVGPAAPNWVSAGEMLSDLPISLSDFTDLLIHYVRQVAGVDVASFFRFLGVDFLRVSYLGDNGIRLSLDDVIT